MLDELTEVGAIDPAAKRQLMADLREAKPENWPLIVRQFRSALALVSSWLSEKQRETRMLASAVASGDNPEKTTPAVLGKQHNTTLLSSKSTGPSDVSLTAERPLAVAVSHWMLSPPKIDLRKSTAFDGRYSSASRCRQLLRPHRPLVATPRSQPLTQPVRYTTTIDSPIGWQTHLHKAIDDLRTSVQPVPGSSDEVSQHMRLRLLQLLSGNEEAAMRIDSRCLG